MNRHANKVLVSLALLVSMLFSLLPNLPQATATDLTAATPQEAAVLPEKSPVYQLDASCKLLSYVDEAVFAEANHIARLPSEETLSTYAFLNSDGTKTVYYMNEAVKFLDSDGNVVEKDIALTAASGGYTTTRNNISLALPSDPAEGIRLTYEGEYITLTPQGGTFRTATQATESAVTYPNFYGAGTSLVYTPTLSGVTGDIVLQSYTGVSSFTFTLNTNGLNLYQANGRYYLAEGKTAVRRFELGDMVAFDARGQFSVGTTSVTTVMPGQAYRITVTVDEDFLADSGTVYPLSVTSSITVKDTGTVVNAIEDTSIYSGRPTMNANWPYMHCGYYSSDYKIGRILVRLTGLTSSNDFQTLNANQIISAKFHIREATGTAALDINLYSNTGSSAWTEGGATWSNAGVTLGACYATVPASGNSDAVFDITGLVRAWKTGLEIPARGFVLVCSNETSLSKGFCSSEFGTTSYRPYVVVDYNLNAEPPVPDGVYRIISKSANKPIGAAQSIADGTNVATQNTYTESALEMFQLWKITHLANGLYSVRPLHKLTMGLHASGTDVYICATSTIDTIVSIPTIARWQIQETTNGYTFQQLGNPNATMMAATSETGSGVDICIGTYSASSAQCHFELSPVEDTQGALFLFNTTTNTYTSSLSSGMPTVTVGVGSQKTLAEIGYVLSVCDTEDSDNAVVWSSSNPAVALVNRTTGTVTPLSTGETIISVAGTIGDTYHIVSYKLVVEIWDGTYYIRNASTEEEGYVDKDSSATPFLAPFKLAVNPWWTFTHLGNGVFTIRPFNSTTLYLGINDQNVVLKTTTNSTNDATIKWTVSASTNGKYRLSPLSDSTMILSASSSGSLQLQNSSSSANEWYLYQHNPCGLNVYFDDTHLALKGQNVAYATNEILEQLETVQAEYLERFNIQLYFNTPESHQTYANKNCEDLTPSGKCSCDGTCLNSSGWTKNELKEIHHTNLYNILHRIPQPVLPMHATVLYVGHIICQSFNGYCNEYDTFGLDVPRAKASVLATYLETKPEADYTRTLMHEIGHLFDVKDHYNSSVGSNTPFSDFCIYGSEKNDANVTENLIICAGCQETIRENANKYHELSLLLEELQ